MKETVPLPFDTPEFVAIWQEWLAYRRERRLKAYTLTGLKRTFTMLRKLGPERSAAAIDNSMSQHYQGIFEPSVNTRLQSNGAHRGVDQWLEEENNRDPR